VSFSREAQRAKAFDYLFDAVVVTDMNGLIVDWNKGSEVLYGYAKEEAIGRPVSLLHVPEDSATITTEVLASVQKDGKWSGEIRMLHKDGRVGWVESMCVPFYNEDGVMEGALGINRDITQRRVEAEKLQFLAHYDNLTKVPNRYLLFEHLKHLIEQSKRNHRTFALFFVDLDKFKRINDSRGHAFGDQVLIETAKIFKRNIRNSDTIARYGGDEFVLLLEDVQSKSEALNMMRTLSAEVSSDCMINGEKFNISFSIGAALFPEDGVTAEQLIASADKAMYSGKPIQDSHD
jgi:diguanylate cyclase (GGDEF)-like protein/PAS domain S-box-containing protein